MSAFDLFSNSGSGTAPAAPTASAGAFDAFKASTPAPSSAPAAPAATNNFRVATLPAFLGGGAYNIDPSNPLSVINTGHTTYGGDAKGPSGTERDDIIPVSLGGANSDPANIQIQPGLGTGGAADQSDKLEKSLAQQVKSGAMTLPQARLAVMTQKQEQKNPLQTGFWNSPFWRFTSSLPSAVGEATGLSAVSKLPSAIAGYAKDSTAADTSQFHVNGQIQKLKQLISTFKAQGKDTSQLEATLKTLGTTSGGDIGQGVVQQLPSASAETAKGLVNTATKVVGDPAVGIYEQATGNTVGPVSTPLGTFQSPQSQVTDLEAQGYSKSEAIAMVLSGQAVSAGMLVGSAESAFDTFKGKGEPAPAPKPTEPAAEPNTVYRGTNTHSVENPSHDFYTTSKAEAERYAKVNTGIAGEPKVESRSIEGLNFKDVPKNQYLAEMSNPETRANFDGIKFQDGEHTTYAVFKAPAEAPAELPNLEAPKSTSMQLNSGFDPGVDKFIAEDVKPVIEKAKEATSVVTSGVKQAVDFIKGSVDQAAVVGKSLGKDVSADVMRGIHTPEAESVAFDNAKSRTLDKNFSQVEKWFGKLPEDTQKNFLMTIGDAETPEGKALQAKAKEALPPELQDPNLQKAVREAFDYTHELAKTRGLDLNYVKDYVYGNYKDPALAGKTMDYLRSTGKYSKEKVFMTPADAAAHGLEHKTYNPITNAKQELTAVARRVGLKEVADKWSEQKAPFQVDAKEATPEQRATMQQINDPAFQGKLYDPKLAKLVNNLLETNKVSQNLFTKTLRGINHVAQAVKFAFSAFHLQNEIKTAISNEAFGVFDPRGYKDFAQGFQKLDTSDPAYKEYVNLGGGNKFSQESQTLSMFKEGFDKINRGNYLGAATKAITGTVRIPVEFTNWMFNDLIPKLKFDAFTRDVAAKGEKLGRPLTDAEKIDIIRRNQNFYGEMNERLFGRTGTATSAMRLAFTAPGYGEGNFRTIFNASTGDMTSARFVANTLVTSAVTATIATRLLTGKWPSIPKTGNQIRDLFKIDTGQKDGNGDEVYYDMMTYDKDYWSVYGNAATGQFGKIPQQLSTRVAGIFSSPAKALTDLASIVEGKNIVDYKNAPIYFRTDPLAVKIQKFIQYENGEALPISVGTFTQSKQKGTGALQSAVSAFVGTKPTTSEDVKDAKAARQDLFSLQDEKKQMQITLDKLAAENPDEAARQAKAFNDKQTKKLNQIFKGQQVNLTTSQYLIGSLNPKGKTSRGTTLQTIASP
jgi:hypothetical protein